MQNRFINRSAHVKTDEIRKQWKTACICCGRSHFGHAVFITYRPEVFVDGSQVQNDGRRFQCLGGAVTNFERNW